MPITNVDQIFAGFGSGPVVFYKASQTPKNWWHIHSMWRAAGNPGAGVLPPLFTAGSGYACSSSTAGALPYTNPTSPAVGYFGRCFGSATQPTIVRIYDRLWHCRGFDANTTSVQTITTPGTLPARDRNGTTDGVGVEAFFEIYGATGGTAGTWTLSYTASDGSGPKTGTCTKTSGADVVGQLMPISLAGPDLGVRAPISVTLNASGASGDVGVTLARLIAEIPVSQGNFGGVFDPGGTGLARLYDNSCLFLVASCANTITGAITGSYTWIHA